MQAEWRAKNLEKSKHQNREKNKTYRERLKETLAEDERKEERRKNAERQRLFRLRKKEKLEVSQALSSDSAFKSPQVKGKVMKKARQVLTGTVEQNKSILKSLMNEYADESPQQARVPTGYNLSPIVLQKVKEFFYSDEISRASPNTEEFVTVMENQQKKKLSVKHLLYPIKECYGMFCSENPELKISLSKFFKLRPPNVLSFTKIPHNVCVCQVHENLRCSLKSLKKSHLTFENLLVDYKMHKNFVCIDSTQLCFENQCEQCCNSSKLKEMATTVENLMQVVTWSKWVKTNKHDSSDGANQYCNIEKVKKTGSIQELLDEIYLQVPDFLDHQFVKMNQAKTSELMIKRALQHDSDTAVICCDFAEKFKCIQQNATQSAHYGQTPVSLFTVAIYHRNLTSMTIASDCEKHTKDSVLAYIDIILEMLPNTAKTVNIWSDNATSQFKNQFIMEGIKSFEKRHSLTIKWHFYAPMHGKSIVDGIGGSVKRYVRDRILAQDLLVKTAEDFVRVASEMEILVKLVSSEAIEAQNIVIGLQNIVKSSKKVQDIKKKHSFEVEKSISGKKNIEKIIGFKITPELV